MKEVRLERQIKVRENGKISASLKRDESGTIGGMKVDESRISILESKVNGSINNDRRFVLVVRNSNSNGEYKLAQLTCNEQDLIDIRDAIDLVLETTYIDKNKMIGLNDDKF